MFVIPGLDANLFSVTPVLQKVLQVTSEGESLILLKPTVIGFDKKMANKAGEGFKLTTKFYNISNNSAILTPKKQKREGKAFIHTEAKAAKKQENTKTKQIAMLKIHVNDIHTWLSHPR